MYSTKSISLSYIRGEYYVSLCIVTKKCSFILYKNIKSMLKNERQGTSRFSIYRGISLGTQGLLKLRMYF
ncbi:hypothetical protein BTH41_05110 [Bacillus mycoides]|nr:hypothetical protein BTH41_05110 [Bacillus mycoides]